MQDPLTLSKLLRHPAFVLLEILAGEETRTLAAQSSRVASLSRTICLDRATAPPDCNTSQQHDAEGSNRKASSWQRIMHTCDSASQSTTWHPYDCAVSPPREHPLLHPFVPISHISFPMSAPYIQLEDLAVTDDGRDLEFTSPARLRTATWAASDDDSPEPSILSIRDDSSQRPLTLDQHAGHIDRSLSPSPQIPNEEGSTGDNSVTVDDRQSQLPHVLKKDDPSSQWRTCLHAAGWWIPELISSALSVASFVSIVVLLLVYDRRAVARLNMPSGWTLNSILALLATVGRIFLCAPVCSGLLQEMWLYFADESQKRSPRCRLNDLGLFVRASYGTLGSLEFLTHPSLAK